MRCETNGVNLFSIPFLCNNDNGKDDESSTITRAGNPSRLGSIGEMEEMETLSFCPTENATTIYVRPVV